MTSTSRRRTREVALQVLYSLDVNPELDPAAALVTYFDRFADQDRDDAEPGARERVDRPFLEALVHGVTRHRAEIDQRLGELSRNWRVERIARVERTILRMALYELEHRTDVPGRVCLNEAIELAKSYGAADAAAFVNGLLDSALHAPGGKR
jgi:transcription antitermination protein NusB